MLQLVADDFEDGDFGVVADAVEERTRKKNSRPALLGMTISAWDAKDVKDRPLQRVKMAA